MKKTKVSYVIISVFLFLIIGRISIKVYNYWNLSRDTFYKGDIINGKIYFSPDYELNPYEYNSFINYLNISKLLVDSLLNSNIKNIKVYVRVGNGRAYSLLENNAITLYQKEYCNSPFLHEYVHLVLKDFDEFWFQEGLATFITIYLRKNNKKLNRYCDLTDDWFEKQNNANFVQVNDILKRYSLSEVKSLIHTKSYNDLDPKEVMDFYKISTVLCQEIYKIIGIRKMIEIAKSRRFYDKSIYEELKKSGIDVNILIDNWLNTMYK